MVEDALQTLAGGALVGLASAILWVTSGRILGVSGIVGGVVTPRRGDADWRLALVAGLAVGGLVLREIAPASFDIVTMRPGLVTIAAGLLVGFGTRMGSGCTSGHGICGVARLSPRSLAATLAFVLTGMATATLAHVVREGL